MAHFDHQTLEHLKKLCRLECSAEEGAAILDSLQKLLGYVDLLGEVDTKDVKTCRFVLREMTPNRVRDDETIETLSRDAFLANAPDQIGGMIRTPSVMKPGA